MSETEPQPSTARVLGGVVPYLQVEGAVAACAFYRTAFGATIVAQHPVDDKGRTMHVHLHVNGSSIMLGDFFPEYGHAPQPAQAFSLVIMTPDVDAALTRAVAAGATVVMPAADMFWGDRYGSVRDPFGVTWGFNGPVETR